MRRAAATAAFLPPIRQAVTRAAPAAAGSADLYRHRRREHLRLLQRIGRRYALSTAPVQLGPIELTFTRIANPDAVLDEVAAEEDRRERLAGNTTGQRREPQHLPYWAEVWDSAAGLGEYLAGGKAELAGRSVLDLGCGQGLSGCCAAALGASVMFADLEAPSLLLARLNSLPFAPRSSGRPRIRTRRLNWQTDRLAERFDLIVGADILYDRQQWPHLEPFWRQHLAPAGSVLLAEPGRASGEQFIPWIAARQWKLQTSEQRIATRPRPIRLLCLTPL